MTHVLLRFSTQWDSLAIIMIALVTFIGLCVGSFAYRYLKGDTRYRPFFIKLTLLVISVSVMVSVDNLLMLLCAWSLSNLLLVNLMVHKRSWQAAQAAGRIAAKNFSLSTCLMGAAFLIFYLATGDTGVNAIIHKNAQNQPMLIALSLLLIAALIQSAIWPFHRWLISSLNSPTPVSALMHAGLVNGGGFLLVRFAPLYLQHPHLLNVIFFLGLSTALLGTLWKLMQSDVKRMLACSTVGQMGFMLAQCGLGLFPAAVAHLVWHGMFKAYLFLASGSAGEEKRFDLGYPPRQLTFIYSLLCGVCGSLAFGYISNKSWLTGDTTLVLNVVTFIAASQFALPILRFKTLQKLPVALISTVIAGLLYGASVQSVIWLMGPMGIMQPQPLNVLHIIGIVTLILAWISVLFLRDQTKSLAPPSWMLSAYVRALNASQPHPSTVTPHRNRYHY